MDSTHTASLGRQKNRHVEARTCPGLRGLLWWRPGEQTRLPAPAQHLSLIKTRPCAGRAVCPETQVEHLSRPCCAILCPRGSLGPHRGQRTLVEAEPILLAVMGLGGRQGEGFGGLGPGSNPQTRDLRFCTQVVRAQCRTPGRDKFHGTHLCHGYHKAPCLNSSGNKLPSESQWLRASFSLTLPDPQRLSLLFLVVTPSLEHDFQEILFSERMNE